MDGLHLPRGPVLFQSNDEEVRIRVALDDLPAQPLLTLSLTVSAENYAELSLESSWGGCPVQAYRLTSAALSPPFTGLADADAATVLFPVHHYYPVATLAEFGIVDLSEGEDASAVVTADFDVSCEAPLGGHRQTQDTFFSFNAKTPQTDTDGDQIGDVCDVPEPTVQLMLLAAAPLLELLSRRRRRLG